MLFRKGADRHGHHGSSHALCDGLDVIRHTAHTVGPRPLRNLGTNDRSLGASSVLYKPFMIAVVLKTAAELLGECNQGIDGVSQRVQVSPVTVPRFAPPDSG